MKKSITIIIIIAIVLILSIAVFFLGMKTRDNLEKAVSKKDPVTNKTAVTLISESNTEGLERAGVTNSENELILDFLTEALSLYDWKEIENARERLLEAGVTDEELLLFFNNIIELLRNQDFAGLEKMGLTEEKMQLLYANWNQEKAEKFVNETVSETLKAANEDPFRDILPTCKADCSFVLINSKGIDRGNIYVKGYKFPPTLEKIPGNPDESYDIYLVGEKSIEEPSPYQEDITGKLDVEGCNYMHFEFEEGAKSSASCN